jgi:hypothetical protein
VFGVCSSYKNTNLVLLLETKKELLALYKKVYGSSIVTNNEFMKWFVKGFITEAKGISINWATTSITTTKKKIKVRGTINVQVQHKGLFKAKMH